MDKFLKMGIKSFLMALLFYSITILLGVYIFSSFTISDIVVVGIAILAGMFFCTYLIIETIKEYCSK
ncbi:hypothetical protein [Clostridium tertium]|uniref:Uncharacterized protein n=1 Tax=Clostridium tertium TaxID=1559 RepID=A0A6N3GWV9_9CLOT